MKEKLMKYAKMYIEDMSKDSNVDDYIKLMNITFDYTETFENNRIDGILTIYEHGEIEAIFTGNIGR